MSTLKLYRGVWPQNVSKLAKYAVRFYDGSWKITVLYEADAGLRYLAVAGGNSDLADRVNEVKRAFGDTLGGPFYINEYRHIIVPVRAESSGSLSHYYTIGYLKSDFVFEYEGRPLTSKPLGIDSSLLQPGDPWVGPRPGIPYVLAAGSRDIYYETPALTDDDPPAVRLMMTRRVQLSRVLGDRAALRRAVETVASIRGSQGGRFYVNEHSAAFTPVTAGDGNGIDYVYCGQMEPEAWFPEPVVGRLTAI